MDEVDKISLMRLFARKMVEQRDVVNGMLVFSGKPVMSDVELIEVARGALDLIERGDL